MATIKSTLKHLEKFLHHHQHPRKLGNLSISPFGIGTYRMGVKPFIADDPMAEI